jgi:hypothetical protein
VFDSSGSAVYFKLPGFAWLPARLGEGAGELHFNFVFVPEAEPPFSVFDRADAWLTSGERRLPMTLIESGLDVSFRKEWITRWSDAQASEERFAEELEAAHMAADRAANMEW